jgi:hypothetical protein
MEKTLPVYLSDGYRYESCARCGHLIGYAHFITQVLFGKVVLLHTDGRFRPIKCDRPGYW